MRTVMPRHRSRSQEEPRPTPRRSLGCKVSRTEMVALSASTDWMHRCVLQAQAASNAVDRAQSSMGIVAVLRAPIKRHAQVLVQLRLLWLQLRLQSRVRHHPILHLHHHLQTEQLARQTLGALHFILMAIVALQAPVPCSLAVDLHQTHRLHLHLRRHLQEQLAQQIPVALHFILMAIAALQVAVSRSPAAHRPDSLFDTWSLQHLPLCQWHLLLLGTPSA